MQFEIKRIRNKSMVALVRPVSACRHSGVIIKKKKKTFLINILSTYMCISFNKTPRQERRIKN